MNKISSFLAMILIGLYSMPVYAEDDVLKFVEHTVAIPVIEKHFSEYKDTNILEKMVTEYNNMLSRHNGFVSANDVTDTCIEIINDVSKCYDFISDLVTTVSTQTTDTNCKYEVSMAPNKFHIKYKNKNDEHGFIRHCNNYIGWRTFNPGNLVDSPYKCARIGGQAVFENEQIGFKALAYLLTETDTYKDLTLRKAVAIYSEIPPSQYIAFLTNKGINVDKKLSTFKENPEELDSLVHAMATKEGWFNGQKYCQGNENAAKIEDRKGIEYF